MAAPSISSGVMFATSGSKGSSPQQNSKVSLRRQHGRKPRAPCRVSQHLATASAAGDESVALTAKAWKLASWYQRGVCPATLRICCTRADFATHTLEHPGQSHKAINSPQTTLKTGGILSEHFRTSASSPLGPRAPLAGEVLVEAPGLRVRWTQLRRVLRQPDPVPAQAPARSKVVRD